MTRGEERGAGARAGRIAIALVASIIGAMLLAYSLAYVWARGTHRLVHYSGGFIARPHAMHGFGFTIEELVFLPATAAEERVRGVLDPTW
ncbi:MAG: hypothetical protein M3Y87_29815 [Myxococcota bacterium]|nr:hypothetical protein [Myxococcota bacterium]